MVRNDQNGIKFVKHELNRDSPHQQCGRDPNHTRLLLTYPSQNMQQHAKYQPHLRRSRDQWVLATSAEFRQAKSHQHHFGPGQHRKHAQ